MADPLLEGNYPVKALYQALAVAAMCLQEEAATRPLISDVVTTLEFLAANKNEGAAMEEVMDSTSPNRDSDGDTDTDRSEDSNRERKSI